MKYKTLIFGKRIQESRYSEWISKEVNSYLQAHMIREKEKKINFLKNINQTCLNQILNITILSNQKLFKFSELEPEKKKVKLNTAWSDFAILVHMLRIIVCVCVYAPPWGLSTLVKEFLAATRIMQSNLNELSTLESSKV